MTTDPDMALSGNMGQDFNMVSGVLFTFESSHQPFLVMLKSFSFSLSFPSLHPILVHDSGLEAQMLNLLKTQYL